MDGRSMPCLLAMLCSCSSTPATSIIMNARPDTAPDLRRSPARPRSRPEIGSAGRSSTIHLKRRWCINPIAADAALQSGSNRRHKTRRCTSRRRVEIRRIAFERGSTPASIKPLLMRRSIDRSGRPIVRIQRVLTALYPSNPGSIDRSIRVIKGVRPNRVVCPTPWCGPIRRRYDHKSSKQKLKPKNQFSSVFAKEKRNATPRRLLFVVVSVLFDCFSFSVLSPVLYNCCVQPPFPIRFGPVCAGSNGGSEPKPLKGRIFINPPPLHNPPRFPHSAHRKPPGGAHKNVVYVLYGTPVICPSL